MACPPHALIAKVASLSLINIPLRYVHVQSGLLGRHPLYSRNTVPCFAPPQALIANPGSPLLRSILPRRTRAAAWLLSSAAWDRVAGETQT